MHTYSRHYVSLDVGHYLRPWLAKIRSLIGQQRLQISRLHVGQHWTLLDRLHVVDNVFDKLVGGAKHEWISFCEAMH